MNTKQGCVQMGPLVPHREGRSKRESCPKEIIHPMCIRQELLETEVRILSKPLLSRSKIWYRGKNMLSEIKQN